ncbi:hypothetical protein [Streptomyces sp. WG7]|uniref:hypothetical protein n=1 Tax=Streptomyces sp. WG7 TaxID=3417650 RepID=UPI003CE9CCFD
MKSKIVVPVLGVALVALLGLTAKACETIQGGPVHRPEEFRDHVRATTRAGEDAYRALSPAPAKEPYASRQGSTSCVDDLGFDDTGVSRDEPIFTWDLDFASDDDYRAALASLRVTWREDGRTVEKVDNGITATLDDGIRVTLHLTSATTTASPNCEPRARVCATGTTTATHTNTCTTPTETGRSTNTSGRTERAGAAARTPGDTTAVSAERVYTVGTAEQPRVGREDRGTSVSSGAAGGTLPRRRGGHVPCRLLDSRTDCTHRPRSSPWRRTSPVSVGSASPASRCVNRSGFGRDSID